MQFEVSMRDGTTHKVNAKYIEVSLGRLSSYTLLGPVPNHRIAVVAAFPVDLVRWVCPSRAPNEGAPARTAGPPVQLPSSIGAP